jgi:(1->4)-alpha-D-glucan 1-alpha-D-glucosylmutase
MKNMNPEPRIPLSTYRLQFNRDFSFSDATAVIRYLSELGISDIYASPYFKAKEGSMHGYDIVDHGRLNPELGTDGEYDNMTRELKRYGMGQILDIVPNHMGIGRENAWWMDVLENGPSSIHADYFDIDWAPVKKELKNELLLPVLGAQYGNVLENQELKLVFEEGAFFIFYYEHKFPIRPRTYIHILQHRLQELEQLLSKEDPHLTELLSIITAIGHLPSVIVRDHDKVEERYREKEIIKKRLLSLYSESLEIRAFIDENVRIFNGLKGNPRSFDLLDELLNHQAYRLSFWRVATEEINYRRFFDINDLAAIRMENQAVFRETHKLVFQLIREGKITGLRIDHPDGLYNPPEYFQWLQRSCFLKSRIGADVNADQPEIEKEILKQYDEEVASDPNYKPFYIVGEKILIRGERMPEDWPIFSTTGYVFLNSLNGIFVDVTSAKAVDGIYTKFIREKPSFQNIMYEKKKLIMQVAMASEVHVLAHYLNDISEKNRHTRDFTLNSLRSALVEVISFFPVYRTYITRSGVNDRDRRYIEAAGAKAKKENPAISELIYEFIKDVLLLNYPEHFNEKDREEWLDFVMRFQQITGPVMAKGVEDTAFYVYNRFVSLNEVGGSPDRFGTPLETFHGQNIERMKHWPHAMIASSTHDSKRSEDVRARINVLSETPGEWRDCLMRWSRLNKKRKPVIEGLMIPDRNEEYLLYQTLIGAWPLGHMDGTAYENFVKRTKDYMLKAVREAKVNTSWINPNTVYEDALMLFIEKIMNPPNDNQFMKDFLLFQKRISDCGMFNSLSQTLLKITSPGVPDFYQGTEIWDFSLVDPDNRRPVDYEKRTAMLENLKRRESEIPLNELARELTVNRENGEIKLYLTYRALHCRRTHREVFQTGEYIPLEVTGGRANNICTFARRTGDGEIVVAAPRFFTGIIQQPEGLPFGDGAWEDSCVVLSSGRPGTRYRNIFTGEDVTSYIYQGAAALRLTEIIRSFPVALMERTG